MQYLESDDNHPLNNPNFYLAIAQDYLELMGETDDMQTNTLLIEYNTDTLQEKPLIADNGNE